MGRESEISQKWEDIATRKIAEVAELHRENDQLRDALAALRERMEGKEEWWIRAFIQPHTQIASAQIFRSEPPDDDEVNVKAKIYLPRPESEREKIAQKLRDRIALKVSDAVILDLVDVERIVELLEDKDGA